MGIYLLLFGLGYLGLCYYLARVYLSPLRTAVVMPSGLESAAVPTSAGPTPAWATPALAAGKPREVVFILAHGYGGSRQDWDGLMQALDKRGIDAVAPAMPGQDASPDATVGFGAKEAKVIVETAQWVRQARPDAKIVFAGISMGGSAAWLASELDPSAAGVVSEGAFARFDEAMRFWFDRKAPGASVYLAPVIWFARGSSGLNPSSIVPMDAAAKWKGRPALVIHGTEDRLILPPHAGRLASASGAELWMIDDARHAQGIPTAGVDAYADRLAAFARRL